MENKDQGDKKIHNAIEVLTRGRQKLRRQYLGNFSAAFPTIFPLQNLDRLVIGECYTF